MVESEKGSETPLLLSFRITFEKYETPIFGQHSGPLFHRWLPDGEKDAVSLDTTDPNAQLRVWFERSGFVGTLGFIEFNASRKEVDPSVIPKQGILEAGPLWGALEIKELAQGELKVVRENRIGEASYEALGKRIVKKLLGPPVIRFINILRVSYGQYWMRELHEWDSTKESLGYYCKSIHLKWSLDEGETWTDFLPNKPVVMVGITATVGNGRRYREYLTKQDWQDIVKAARSAYEPSLAGFLLMRAHQFSDEANYKYALIEGVSALEIALREYVRRTLEASLLNSMSAFWELPLRYQIVASATFAGRSVLSDLGPTVEAIEMRNKIVHEGWDPPSSVKRNITALMRTASALLDGPNFKFPHINPGNTLMPPEEWEKTQPR